MMLKKQVVIVGGGLAGLTCAIHLRKVGIPVTIIEKSSYPHHKVCGEFISNEVRSYLLWLDIDISKLGPIEIQNFSISSRTGKIIRSPLPLGGFGLSRYSLDHYLFEHALSIGCEVLNDNVENIAFRENEFSVYTQANGVLKSELVIGAFGKRSSIDQKLGRAFFQKKSPWLAVKAHYRGSLESNNVSLHTFDGGYCGISAVENAITNVCYLTDYRHFKAHRNVEEFQRQVLFKNPNLRHFFENSEMVFTHPLVISQISFSKKKVVDQHILMIGDTAGLIHPLCGNGMAMAIHSAKLCGEACEKYLKDNNKNRLKLETAYREAWKSAFQKRLLMGRVLSSVIRKGNLFGILLFLLAKFPSLLPKIIRGTHGKPNI